MLLNILWVLGVGGLVVADRIPPYASVQTDNDHPLLVRRGGSTLLSRSGSSSSIGIDAPLKHNIPSSNTSSTHSPSRNSRLPRNDYENFDYYAVQLDDNNGAVSGEQLDEHAAALAYAHGLNLLGRIGNMNSYYYFSTEKKWRRLRQGDDDLTLRIQSSSSSSTPLVAWVSRQLPRKLTRRAMITEQLSGCTASSLPTSRLDPRGPPLRVNQTKLGIFDPEFKNQWHLFNSETAGNDINVLDAWYNDITGKNVTVCFVDDGIDFNHKDLQDRYLSKGSHDFNDNPKDMTNQPIPRLPEDRHGTRCAGEVAASRNDVCGVGVAWDAKVSGIRILSGDLTEADEASAIIYENQINQIYSCSWGPSDNGIAMDAPPRVVADAFKEGIIKGRGGLGSLFVFATGNGGSNYDNCNFDGYTNSIFTITVGAIDRYNNHPTYSEECSAQMVVTYSSGSGAFIHTTDWHDKDVDPCTNSHGGTSAAAPLASGIYALVMSVRPDFSWRDFQHVSVQSALPINLDKDDSWVNVAKGRKYSHRYGFGKLDTAQILSVAKGFTNVGPQTSISPTSVYVEQTIPHGNDGLASTITISQADVDSAKMLRMEHVTVTVSISHQRRGEVQVWLTSPSGYVSILATARRYDHSVIGFRDWTFMSVKHWEENPVGVWTIKVFDNENSDMTGKFEKWKLILYGEQKSSPPTIPSTTTTAVIISSTTSSTTASTTAVPPLDDTVPTTTPQPPQPEPPSSSSSKFIFVILCLAVVGSVSFYFWRRKKQRAAVIPNDTYAFQELDESEILDNFEYDEEEV